MKNHINVVDLLAIKLAKQTFSKTLKHKAIRLQVGNMVALRNLLKTGSTQNLRLAQLAIGTWDHLLRCKISLTAEYLPSKLNVTADCQAMKNLNFLEWKLASKLFRKICQLRETPEKIKTYFFLKLDPLILAKNALQEN